MIALTRLYRCPWCRNAMAARTETMTINRRQEFPQVWEAVVLTCPTHGEMFRADPADIERWVKVGIVTVIKDEEAGGSL